MGEERGGGGGRPKDPDTVVALKRFNWYILTFFFAYNRFLSFHPFSVMIIQIQEDFNCSLASITSMMITSSLYNQLKSNKFHIF